MSPPAARSPCGGRPKVDRPVVAYATHAPVVTWRRSAGTFRRPTLSARVVSPQRRRRPPRRKPAQTARGTEPQQDHECTADDDHRPARVTRTGHAEPATSSAPKPLD